MTETLVPPYLYAVTLIAIKTGPGQSGWALSVDAGACTLMTRAHSLEEAEGIGWREMRQLYPEAAGWEKQSVSVLAVTASMLAGAHADPWALSSRLDHEDAGHGES